MIVNQAFAARVTQYKQVKCAVSIDTSQHFAYRPLPCKRPRKDVHVHAQLDPLSAEISAANLSRPEIEGIVYQLSRQQRRLFLRLAAGPATTFELRAGIGLGNICQVAGVLNAKLRRAGDPRHVACAMRVERDRFGAPVRVGEWRLVEGASNV